ncbi:hypothetical protein K8T06_07030 [bacterium]|nr:hypothetical protein [bacterium]
MFVVPAQGGQETRLTVHSADDIPVQWKDGEIIFRSNRLSHLDMGNHLFITPLTGGTPRQILGFPVDSGQYSPDGTTLVFVERSTAYNQWWRRHYQGAASLAIWKQNTDTGQLTRISGSDENDLWPLWAGENLYCTAERDGSKNLCRINSHNQLEQLTQHSGRGVEFPGIALNGNMLAYECNGAVWTYNVASGKSVEIEIHAISGAKTNDVEHKIFHDGASNLTVSPSGKELAFIVHGKIFVMKASGGKAKRLTRFQGREGDIAWSPENDQIAFVCNRNGQVDLYVAHLPKSDVLFSETLDIAVKQLTNNKEMEGRPVWSPDSGTIVFVHGAYMTLDRWHAVISILSKLTGPITKS